MYRGVFGSHVANVLRRLRRLARAYGAEPLFILASATIADPGELASRLTGLDVRVVDTDTSPRAEREVVLWNPELLDDELGVRASPLGDASRLLAGLVGSGLRGSASREPQGGRARPPVRDRSARRGDGPAARALPGRLTRSSGATSSGGSSRASCSASPPRTPSSSASTSARSTARSPSGFPGLSPRCASNGDGRAPRARAGGADRERGRARPVLRRRSAGAARATTEAALIDHATPRILDGHVLSAAYEGPLTEADAEILGREALARAAVLPELEPTPPASSGAAGTRPLHVSRSAPGTRRGTSSSTKRPVPCSGQRNASERSRRCTTAPSTSTSATSTPSRGSTS